MSGYSTTPNLGLKKPLTGADDDQWGTHWNSNADTLDAALAGGGPFLPLTGGAISPGPLLIAGGHGRDSLRVGPWTETETTGPFAPDIAIQHIYNMPPSAFVGTLSSFAIQSFIQGAPTNYIWPINVQMFMRGTGHTSAQHVGIASTVWRESGSGINFLYFGQLVDMTGVGLSNDVVAEYDIRANGPEPTVTGVDPRDGGRTYFELNAGAYSPPVWQASHAYAVNAVVQPSPANGFTYICTVAGTSAGTQPVWPVAPGTVTNGGVTWSYGTTVAMQVSRAIAISGEDANVQFGAGIVANARFYDAILECSTATLVDGGVKDAAIRLTANMPIDFSANGTDAGQNVRTLRYNGASGAFEYKAGATVRLSLPDAKPVVSGSRGGNAAVASLLTALAAANLITDSTTA